MPKILPGAYPNRRMRRNRFNPRRRDLMAETRLAAQDLILPLFIIEGDNKREPIASLPGIERLSIDLATEQAHQAAELGIPGLLLFPAIDATLKTADGAEACNPDTLICRAARALKQSGVEIELMSDIALDPYTDHGHDGVLDAQGYVANDATVAILCRQALNQAEAGIDIVAPSDMMDGRIGAIRQALDQAGHEQVAILSYAAKYASGFYGPFREAVGSSGRLKGDKCGYQMDPRNGDEALAEAHLDLEEGADMIMVKPGLPYLDIIRRLHEIYACPLLAYQVSGEYAMLKHAAHAGALDWQRAMLETLTSFRRAGCDAVVTYAALEVAAWLREETE